MLILTFFKKEALLLITNLPKSFGINVLKMEIFIKKPIQDFIVSDVKPSMKKMSLTKTENVLNTPVKSSTK